MESSNPSDTVNHRPLWAQIVSDVFSPLLVPAYGMAMAMWATPMRVIPEKTKILALILVLAITGLLPLLCIGFLKRLGFVSDTALSQRRQRGVPMTVGAMCYVGCALMLASLGAPIWLRLFFIGAAIAAAIALAISCFWKISAHATAIGGLNGLVLWLTLSDLVDINAMIMLTAVILVSGLVGTCRLMLLRHSLAQVIAGFFLGLASCMLSMIFLWPSA